MWEIAGDRTRRRSAPVHRSPHTTAATPEYDATHAVIGRVLEGMDSIKALDQVTTVKAADVFQIEATQASRAKACQYDSPQPFCAQGKPLKKVTLLRTAVL